MVMRQTDAVFSSPIRLLCLIAIPQSIKSAIIGIC
ncbi:MAG: hypothetical protein JW388_1679 [Nitrospira sp.]|nr:hypothetical protein [Nitrospira sp.]